MICHFCPLPLSHPLPLLSSLLVFVLFLEHTEHIPTQGPFCGLLPLLGTFFPCLSVGLAPLPPPILCSEVTFALESVLITLLKIVTYHPYHFWLPLLFLFFSVAPINFLILYHSFVWFLAALHSLQYLIPQPGIELITPTVEASSPNHLIVREVPLYHLLVCHIYYLILPPIARMKWHMANTQ